MGKHYIKCLACGKKQEDNFDIKFFCLPDDSERREIWLKNLNKPELINTKVSKDLRVCEAHFSIDEISKVRIKKNAIPNKIVVPGNLQIVSVRSLANGEKIDTNIQQEDENTDRTVFPTTYKSSLSTVTEENLREEDMVIHFRVFELQRLLTTLNASHVGRKTELQDRLLDLLRTNFSSIAPKIQELFQSCRAGDNSDHDLGAPDPKRMYQSQMLPVQSDVRTAIVGNNLILPSFPNQLTPGYPIHPDVRLKKLAFYDVLATLLQPSTLMSSTAHRMQEQTYYFTLTPQQATEIASNRDIRGGTKVEHVIQVQLRFCLLETSCEQDDCFPPNVIVKVNNKICPLPNPIPTNRPNVEPKRPPRAVNVTQNVKLSPTVSNTITIQWCADSPRGYVISAYLVKRLTSAQLLNRMRTKGIKPADYTRALIKEKLAEDADCEIATTMLKVSLICPLGKMRMTIPCRASTCSHLQCFDASLYLQMNERKPTWNCPVCDKPAIFETLVIDGYFQEVLASPLLSSDDNEIQLHKDGSWSTNIMRNDSQSLDTPQKPIQKVEVISDDLEVITTEIETKPIAKSIIPSKPQVSITSVVNNNEPTSTTNSETVDLTLSDSDDDLPLARTASVTKSNNNSNANNATSTNNTTTNHQKLNQHPTSTKIKQKDDFSSSIITLDSPSPPSTPNRDLNESGGVNSTGVTSTTTTYCPLPLPSDPLPHSNDPSSSYQLNPLALSNRYDQPLASLAFQRLIAEQHQQSGHSTISQGGYQRALMDEQLPDHNNK